MKFFTTAQLVSKQVNVIHKRAQWSAKVEAEAQEGRKKLRGLEGQLENVAF